MNIKRVFALILCFVIGFVAGSTVTLKGMKLELKKQRAQENMEQGQKIGV